VDNSTAMLLASIADLAFAAVCGYLAWHKGRSVLWYVLFGLLFSIITLVVILLLPPKRTTV
jgi:hypothetical protein